VTQEGVDQPDRDGVQEVQLLAYRSFPKLRVIAP
jgi:hypothetical protein